MTLPYVLKYFSISFSDALNGRLATNSSALDWMGPLVSSSFYGYICFGLGLSESELLSLYFLLLASGTGRSGAALLLGNVSLLSI